MKTSDYGPRLANSYRGARRMLARKAKLLWRHLERETKTDSMGRIVSVRVLLPTGVAE